MPPVAAVAWVALDVLREDVHVGLPADSVVRFVWGRSVAGGRRKGADHLGLLGIG
jgi:hypothetical protein